MASLTNPEPRRGVTTLRRRLDYVLWAALGASGFYALSTWIFVRVAHSNVLAASIWNLGAIVAVLTWDRLESRALWWLHRRIRRGGRTALLRLVEWFLTGASLKTSLYLFYILVLAGTAVLEADPDFAALQGHVGYLGSVRYGLLILVAADKFLERVFKDMADDSAMRARAVSPAG